MWNLDGQALQELCLVVKRSLWMERARDPPQEAVAAGGGGGVLLFGSSVAKDAAEVLRLRVEGPGVPWRRSSRAKVWRSARVWQTN